MKAVLIMCAGVGAGFLAGCLVRRASVRVLIDLVHALVQENGRLRHDTVRRPVSNVGPVEPDESDHIVAEWLSMYDPRYHTENP